MGRVISMNDYRVKIKIKKKNWLITDLKERIENEIIGQDRAIRRLLRSVIPYYHDLNDPRRPIGGFIFAGPTGVGKTFTAKVFARHFLNGSDRYRDYLTRIDGSTLSEGHEVSKLKGSPPGYIGYGDINLLAQVKIDGHHFDVKAGHDNGALTNQLYALAEELQEGSISKFSSVLTYKKSQIEVQHLYESNKPYCSVILFDEIEKAHPNIWNLLLQIMEEGKLQMGRSDEETNFSHSVIILTTNIGQKNIQGLIGRNQRGKIGFGINQSMDNKKLDEEIYQVTKEQIKKKFPPELFRRLDLIVFRPLKKEDFKKILDNFLLDEQERIDNRMKFFRKRLISINYTEAAKNFLLEKGIDIYYGARTLRVVVEKYIRAPIANGLINEEILPGDKILVDRNNNDLVFFRKYRQRGQNAIKRRNPVFDIENKLVQLSKTYLDN